MNYLDHSYIHCRKPFGEKSSSRICVHSLTSGPAMTER